MNVDATGGGPVLLVADALYPQANGTAAEYGWELARALGCAALSLTPDPEFAEWTGLRILTRAANESAMQAWLRALDEVQPRVVLVLELRGLPPSALLELRERAIPYALVLHDYTQICPTHRLWHRRQEICSGPGRTGLKCAWCVSGSGRRWPELPARTYLYQHYPHQWQVAMAGAEALIAVSRSLRDAWIAHGAPPERLLVVPPIVPPAEIASPAAPRPSRTLLYAGGWDEAEGTRLLAEALEALRQPITLELVGGYNPAAESTLRAAVPDRHPLRLHGRVSLPALGSLLAASGAAVMPARWQQSYGRLIDFAQLYGTPPVATAIGGIPERVIHGLNGFLAEPDDAGSLAEAIEAALAPAEEEPWDAGAARRQVDASAAAGLAKLRRLLALLAGGAAHAATQAEFAAPLEAAQAEFGLSDEPAFAHLRSALETPAHTEDLAEAAFGLIATAASRARRVHLNHALACFHAAGARAVLCVGGGIGDAARWFTAWGCDARNAETSAPLARMALRLGARPPDGAFHPDGFFLDRRAAGDLADLRRRYPQAEAVIAEAEDGIQIL